MRASRPVRPTAGNASVVTPRSAFPFLLPSGASLNRRAQAASEEEAQVIYSSLLRNEALQLLYTYLCLSLHYALKLL